MGAKPGGTASNQGVTPAASRIRGLHRKRVLEAAQADLQRSREILDAYDQAWVEVAGARLELLHELQVAAGEIAPESAESSVNPSTESTDLPPDDLLSHECYRDVALKLHPDRANSEDERTDRTHRMAEFNAAWDGKDLATIARICFELNELDPSERREDDSSGEATMYDELLGAIRTELARVHQLDEWPPALALSNGSLDAVDYFAADLAAIEREIERLESLLRHTGTHVSSDGNPDAFDVNEPSEGSSNTQTAQQHNGAPTRESVAGGLASEIVQSERFVKSLIERGRARLDASRVQAALTLMLTQGGRCSYRSLADTLSMPEARVPGFLALASQVLNIDGFPVMRLDTEEHEARLDRSLLLKQFVEVAR